MVNRSAKAPRKIESTRQPNLPQYAAQVAERELAPRNRRGLSSSKPKRAEPGTARAVATPAERRLAAGPKGTAAGPYGSLNRTRGIGWPGPYSREIKTGRGALSRRLRNRKNPTGPAGPGKTAERKSIDSWLQADRDAKGLIRPRV